MYCDYYMHTILAYLMYIWNVKQWQRLRSYGSKLLSKLKGMTVNNNSTYNDMDRVQGNQQSVVTHAGASDIRNHD